MGTDALTLPAPAKLNLFLHVTGRRDDGYHTLQTVFQLLDWGDLVRLAVLPGERIERDAEVEGVSETDDLTLRAARSLQAAARAEGRPFAGARIGLDKHIPLGSGLGGASTDAATVLLGLNELWGCGFDQPALASLALGLGADVPVFVHGRSAWAEGVGEHLEPLALGERWYVLLFPGVGASTAELFADPRLRRDAPPRVPEVGTDWCALGNDFLPVLLERSPRVAEAYRLLEQFGTPRLTGSGSTLFLEAAGREAAERLTSDLKIHYNVRAARGRDRSATLDAMAARDSVVYREPQADQGIS